MNELDYVLLGVVMVSALLAVGRGFVRELTGVLGWLSAFVVAARFAEPVAHYLGHVIAHEPTANRVAYFLIFASVLVLFGVIGQLLKHLFGQTGLSLVDRFMGFCFGLTRGILILMIGFLVMNHFFQEHTNRPIVAQSQISPYFIQGANWTVQQLPPQWVLNDKKPK